jgi:hypothetical protein
LHDCFLHTSSMAEVVWSHSKLLQAKEPSPTIIWRSIGELFRAYNTKTTLFLHWIQK